METFGAVGGVMKFVLALVMVLVVGHVWAWPAEVKPVLSEDDAARYKKMFEDARYGKKPLVAHREAMEDTSLLADVDAMYLEYGRPTYEELKGWINKHGEYPQAAALYSDAKAKRPMPKRTCTTTKIKQKDGTLKKKRSCKTTGTAAPLPEKPLAVLMREQRARDAEAAREAQYDGLSPGVAAQRREVLGEVWRLRQRGLLSKAGEALNAPGARDVVGVVRWQEEVVRTGEGLYNLREFDKVVNVVRPATTVSGPMRDDARWLAGFASYRVGDYETAAKQLEALVKEEPVNGKFYARAAWWGARAYERLGNRPAAKALLAKGAQDQLTFYGQLAGAKAGIKPQRAWTAPRIAQLDIEGMQKRELVRRAMALAQVGEVDLAQQVFKQANEDIPYNMTQSLAAFALEAKLPGTALRAGQALYEQGETQWSVLYPNPKQWEPRGGMKMDRALMLAIMRQESAFQPAVGSRVGAQGLMQLMPATARYIARLTGRPAPVHRDLHEPETNMLLAQDYVGYLGEKLGGNMIHLIASYNAGPGNVGRWRTRGITPDGDPLLYVESIPIFETRDYVMKVMANWWIYQDALGQRPWALEAMAENYWPVVDTATGQGTRRRLAAQ